MQRRAFTAIEALMTFGIIAITTSVTIPVYRNYQVRSELMDATDQLLTAMRGAQLRARAGETAGTWGVYTVEGVLFQGDSYEERNPAYDELYPLPPSVTVTGLEEVIFLPLSGLPSSEGEVLLTANNGDSRTILVGDQGTIAASGLSIPSVIGGGASEGSGEEGEEEEGASSSAASGASSVAVSGVSSSAGTSEGAASATSASAVPPPPASEGASAATSAAGTSTPNNQGAQSSSASAASADTTSASSDSSASSSQGTTCEDRFYVGPDGSLQTTGTVRATFTALGSQITYGSNGPEIAVTVQASTDGGRTWTPLFGARDIDGSETDEITQIPSGSKIVLRVTGKHSWQFNRAYASNEGNGQIVVLRNGDKLPAYKAFDSQQSLATFLQPIVSDKKIVIGTFDAVYLVELGSLLSSSADFQDAVIRVSLTQDASCASSSSSVSSSASSDASTSSAGSEASQGAVSSASSSSSQVSSESGKKITICHFVSNTPTTIIISESAWKAHSEHGDRKGACEGDDDDDSIGNAEDFCPGTKVENPKKYLLFFRNALTDGTSDIFRVGPTKKISSYTLEDTGGCSCEQLLDVAEGKPGYYFFNVPSAYLGLRGLLDSYVTTARKYGCSGDLLDYIEVRIKK